MGRFNHWGSAIAAIVAGAGIILDATVGQTAEQVVFRYGIIRQRLAVAELTDFAQGKETSPVMQRYLERANANPAEVKRALNEPITISPTTLKSVLDNPAGDRMLDELGKMIQTPNDQENREALRSALVASAAKDNQVTVLEVIQNYPSDEIHLDVKRMVRTYSRVGKSAQEALTQVDALRQLLERQGIKLPKF
jgi:hypothetical protein